MIKMKLVHYIMVTWIGGFWHHGRVIVEVSTKFLVGDKDIGFESAGTKEYVQGVVFKSLVPDPEVVILEATISFDRREPSKTQRKFYLSSVNFLLNKWLG